MKPLLLILATCMLLLGSVGAQTPSSGGNMPQLPVGQTFRQFEFPIYQNGQLKATLDAIEATGITLNRAETTQLKISVFDNGAVTTTITSPKADLYVSEEKMRTSNTVLISRADMDASSQECDFDLKTKKYLLRTNVKVLLKHFDMSAGPGKQAGNAQATAPAAASGADTNSAPAGSGSDSK